MSRSSPRTSSGPTGWPGPTEAAGGEPARAKTAPELDRALVCADHAIVDLTARAYDPIAAIERARASGARVLAVGPHDDVPLRKRAFAAGADKVLAYRKLFEDGPATIERWLADTARLGAGHGHGLRPATDGSALRRPPDDDRGPPDDPRRALRRTAPPARCPRLEAGLDAVLIGVGPDLDYLTGYRAMPLERLTMLVVAGDRQPVLIAPRLEEPAARAGLRTGCRSRPGWRPTTRTASPPTSSAPRRAMPGVPSGSRCRTGCRRYHLLRLQAHLPGAEWSSATGVLRRLRMVKDADEIELLRLAAEAADRVVDQIASGRLVGRTEADVADEVRDRLRAEGHELAEFAIVASGPNSASPHHEASERVIRAGEPIVLDIGGALGGYGSDTTRTLWVTGGDEANGPDEEFRHLFGVLLRRRRPRPASSGPGWPPRRSTGPHATSSTARATAKPSSTGPATASGSRGTRSRTSSPATTSRSRPGWRSASSRGST